MKKTISFLLSFALIISITTLVHAEPVSNEDSIDIDALVATAPTPDQTINANSYNFKVSSMTVACSTTPTSVSASTTSGGSAVATIYSYAFNGSGTQIGYQGNAAGGYTSVSYGNLSGLKSVINKHEAPTYGLSRTVKLVRP